MTLLFVPYDDNTKVKALGARWDALAKSWYAPAGIPLSVFEQWLAAPGLPAQDKLAQRCSLSQKRMQAVHLAVQQCV